MSKLAHSNQETMDEIEAEERATDYPTALTLIKAIACADGRLRGHEDYLTKMQMIGLCKAWLRLSRPTST
jgi:hypothetical protein